MLQTRLNGNLELIHIVTFVMRDILLNMLWVAVQYSYEKNNTLFCTIKHSKFDSQRSKYNFIWGFRYVCFNKYYIWWWAKIRYHNDLWNLELSVGFESNLEKNRNANNLRYNTLIQHLKTTYRKVKFFF